MKDSDSSKIQVIGKVRCSRIGPAAIHRAEVGKLVCDRHTNKSCALFKLAAPIQVAILNRLR
jgi:hypothetical protein